MFIQELNWSQEEMHQGLSNSAQQVKNHWLIHHIVRLRRCNSSEQQDTMSGKQKTFWDFTKYRQTAQSVSQVGMCEEKNSPISANFLGHSPPMSVTQENVTNMITFGLLRSIYSISLFLLLKRLSVSSDSLANTRFLSCCSQCHLPHCFKWCSCSFN